VNDQQKALLDGLLEIVEKTRKSGALNAAGATIVINRFSRAIAERANDGPALVQYIQSKVREPATDTYSALIKAGRPDLTAEAVVANADAPWASEFTDDDRQKARSRLAAYGPRHRLVHKISWLNKYSNWLFWCAFGVLLDGYVVYRFITASPPFLPGSVLPIQVFPDIPPSFPLAPLVVVGVVLALIYIWVAFARRSWILKAFHLILVVVWLVFSFSLIYYEDGNEQDPAYLDYPAFGHQLSQNEAVYFTVGILTTAGTGDLSPQTDAARTAVTFQMSLDVVVLVIGIAGVVRESRRLCDLRLQHPDVPVAFRRASQLGGGLRGLTGQGHVIQVSRGRWRAVSKRSLILPKRAGHGMFGAYGRRAGQRVDLPGPGPVVGGELVDEQDRQAGASRLGVETDPVRCGYVGHGRSFLSCRRGRATVPAGWCRGWRGASACPPRAARQGSPPARRRHHR
jgi:ion channel